MGDKPLNHHSISDLDGWSGAGSVVRGGKCDGIGPEGVWDIGCGVDGGHFVVRMFSIGGGGSSQLLLHRFT